MKKYVLAMAVSRKEARRKIEDLGQIVQRHVIECVVYSGWQDTRHHWVAEIASWMAKISRINCKVTLREKDYLETLFAWYGDELIDARNDLEDYRDSYIRRMRYPDFEVTPELANKLFDTYSRFIAASLDGLLNRKAVVEGDWMELLLKVFKEN